MCEWVCAHLFFGGISLSKRPSLELPDSLLQQGLLGRQDLKKEDKHKDEDELKNEDNLKMKTTSKMKTISKRRLYHFVVCTVLA